MFIDSMFIMAKPGNNPSAQYKKKRSAVSIDQGSTNMQ